MVAMAWYATASCKPRRQLPFEAMIEAKCRQATAVHGMIQRAFIGGFNDRSNRHADVAAVPVLRVWSDFSCKYKCRLRPTIQVLCRQH